MSAPTHPHRTRGLLLCVLVYLLATAAALAVAWTLRGQHVLLVAGAADVVATLVVFAFSHAFGNASLYDPYWSVAPIPIALYFALQADAPPLRSALLVGLVALWGLRLTFNWVRRWRGLGDQDWRYTMLREKSGALYPLVNLSGIHLFPTLIVFGALWPLQAALAAPGPALQPLDALAAAVTLFAIVIEFVADAQLWRFLSDSTRPKGAFMNGGLWAWSRHPNYFGEVLFWWGLFLFAAARGAWITIIGPLAMTALFVLISVPMMKKRALERREGYAAYAARTSALVPWPPKR